MEECPYVGQHGDVATQQSCGQVRCLVNNQNDSFSSRRNVRTDGHVEECASLIMDGEASLKRDGVCSLDVHSLDGSVAFYSNNTNAVAIVGPAEV
jgi:hypothetical protein